MKSSAANEVFLCCSQHSLRITLLQYKSRTAVRSGKEENDFTVYLPTLPTRTSVSNIINVQVFLDHLVPSVPLQ